MTKFITRVQPKMLKFLLDEFWNERSAVNLHFKVSWRVARFTPIRVAFLRCRSLAPFCYENIARSTACCGENSINAVLWSLYIYAGILHGVRNVLFFIIFAGKFDNICIKDFNNCQQGISLSFWLQFIDGMNVMTITNANNTILSVQVKDNRDLLIQLTAGSKRWQIKRSCFPVDWFYLTITWDHKSKWRILQC